MWALPEGSSPKLQPRRYVGAYSGSSRRLSVRAREWRGLQAIVLSVLTVAAASHGSRDAPYKICSCTTCAAPCDRCSAPVRISLWKCGNFDSTCNFPYSKRGRSSRSNCFAARVCPLVVMAASSNCDACCTFLYNSFAETTVGCP